MFILLYVLNDFQRGFLVPILLNVVLGAGHVNLGFSMGFYSVYFTLCSPRSGPCTICDFRRGFLVSILLYVVLGAGHAH